jgi:CubicO group peptidase (beta-lactamase class C family)
MKHDAISGAGLPLRGAVLVCWVQVLCAVPAIAAGNPGPGGSVPVELPESLEDVPITLLELSWDFGEFEPPDWRKELLTDDPTDDFLLRWRYSGPEIGSAILSVYDRNNVFAGNIALPVGVPDAGGFRESTFLVGDLPCVPTLTMQVRIRDSMGQQIGCASNEVQISEPSPTNPFVDTELFVNGMSTDFGMPGIIGGVSCDTPPGPPFERVFFDGVRKFDGGAGNVAANDNWALGSCTKAMTCTLMGVLIQTGTPLPGTMAVPVSWETPLTDIFPEWDGSMEPRFQSTTLRHLACHRSGLRMTKSEDAETRVIGGANGDPRTFRRTMTYRLLAREHYELDEQGNEIGPVTTPGTSFHYGSGNYLVLGAVIEQLTGVSYEQAMLTRIFVPLGMSSAAFGMPATLPVYYQPHGHYREPELPHPMKVDNLACPPIWNAAGSSYMSVQDWLKFLRLHATGSEGLLTLNPAVLADLHTPFPQPPGDTTSYGFGWWIRNEPGGRILYHNGTYHRFYAACQVHTGRRFAACAVSNLGPNSKKDESGVIVWEDKSSSNAVDGLLWHLVDKAVIKQDASGLPMPGTLGAGSRGSAGILHINLPEEEEIGIIIDGLGPPLSRISMAPAAYPPVCLYLFDEHHRGIATLARRPRALSFVRAGEDLFVLTARTEIGAVYQLWTTPHLGPDAVPEMILETAAAGLTTDFEITPTPRARHEFFWVQDLME